MILNRESPQGLVSDSFQSAIIQIYMGDLNLAFRQAVNIDDKTMVLRSYLNSAGETMHYRMVCTVMAKFQLGCSATQRQSQNLMAQTNPENRFLAQQVPNRFDGVFNRLRIAGTVGENDAIGIPFEHLFRGSMAGKYTESTPVIVQCS